MRKRISIGYLSVLCGMAMMLVSGGSSAWILENKWKDGITAICQDCSSFSAWFERTLALGEVAPCDGNESGCGGGTGAQIRIVIGADTAANKQVCSVDLGNRVNAQGKIVLRRPTILEAIGMISGVPVYDVYTNESDAKPSKSAIPFGMTSNQVLLCGVS